MISSEIEKLIADLRSGDPERIREAADILKKERLLVKGHLAGYDLRGASLQKVNLVGANLAGCCLDGSDLSEIKLVHASLKGASLREASLSGAAIFSTDMSTSDLYQVTLQGTDLRHSDLTGALNLAEAQLRTARSLRAVIMPDGQLYDGRYNLPFDLEDAELHKVAITDPAQMASWYGITEEVYLKGQVADG